MKALIAGAGFAGSITARGLAEAGVEVAVVDRRDHIGGNAYDRIDESGVLIHEYGPHIFHTNSQRVVDWLSRFTEWRAYEHRVLAEVDGQQLPLPINRTTLNGLYALSLDESGAAAFLERVREPRDRILNSEDVVLSSVGRDLCEKFFAGYTRKQWGLELAQLSAGVAARIPTRTNDDDRYFTDRFQAMPSQGYTAMFQKILDHSRICTILGTDFEEVRGKIDADFIVYTGPLDAYFGHCFGKLPYRSLRFEHEHFPEIERMQAVGTVNYPNTHAYTRITEFKHLTGQTHSGTSIVREFPCSDGDPYYPVPRPENEQLFKRYLELADRESDVHFIGRLAQYRYYNMDQVVASAIALSEKLVSRYLQPAGLAIEAEIA
jgi:UDP-galactopyranose mutase